MVYLDNAATTAVSIESADAARSAMLECWGNPSSGHSFGLRAERLFKESRNTLARALGARDDEIYFTSGGTEANNLAILGTARAVGKSKGHIIISAVEHSSVLSAAQRLSEEGFEVSQIVPDRFGRISAQSVADALTDRTVLVSVMLVNNELGSVMPIREIARAIKRKCPSALLHCDAVQAFGKIDFSVSSLGCQLLSVSGHKIHAPKGVGALYISRDVKRLQPLCFGGQQQGRIRPGTEPLPNIAAFAEAVRHISTDRDHIAQLSSYAKEKLLALGCTINSPEDGADHIINFSTGCIKSETMLNFLSSKDICVSSGSACSKGKLSHVLTATGMEHHIADSAIRISFSRTNTTEDIDILCSALSEALGSLVRFR